MDKKLLISFSGGRTSAFMTKLILENNFFKDWEKLVVFANTGKENEETLEFIERCDKEFGFNVVWIEAVVVHQKGKGTNYKVVDFESASRKGEPFEQVIKKYGLPSKLYRHCTRELKDVIINKYAKDIFGTNKFLTAIGIRADEKHRVGKNPAKIYPLVESGVSEEQIRNWWDKQSFDLELKDYQGNCDLCFLKSVRKKKTLIQENPTAADWWNLMEEKYGEIATHSKSGDDIDRTKFDVYRDLSITDLVLASSEEFKKAIDKHEERAMSLQERLFDLDEDLEFDCHCKLG
jgi:3'-phosphoadenosine 5'-phosphosulfate sulfotransferase (PAPS reductase)/FAD synthetase